MRTWILGRRNYEKDFGIIADKRLNISSQQGMQYCSYIPFWIGPHHRCIWGHLKSSKGGEIPTPFLLPSSPICHCSSLCCPPSGWNNRAIPVHLSWAACRLDSVETGKRQWGWVEAGVEIPVPTSAPEAWDREQGELLSCHGTATVPIPKWALDGAGRKALVLPLKNGESNNGRQGGRIFTFFRDLKSLWAMDS